MNKFEKIFGTWAEVLNPFLQHEDYIKIGIEIKQQINDGLTIYPAMQDIFRVFKECPFDKLHTVILTTNAYVKGQSDGIAFSCRHKELMSDTPAVLSKVLDAVESDTGGLYLDRNNDLTRWANQGILLLNLDLTTVQGQPKAHLDLWEPFIQYIVKILNLYKNPYIFVFIGEDAKKYAEYVNPIGNDTYFIEHPMISVMENRPWNHEKIFDKLTRIVKLIHKRDLKWTN